MADVTEIPSPTPTDDHGRELVREAATMALYVAICLLAALTVASSAELEQRSTVLKVVWGTTVGLALAHWFAFRLSARLVSEGTVRRSDAELVAAQFVGSIGVAALATVAVILFEDDAAPAASWVIAAFIAFVGYTVALTTGAPRLRAVLYASGTTLAAFAIVTVKNVLAGH